MTGIALCACCGSEGKITGNTHFYVRCNNKNSADCWLSPVHSTEAEAIAAWNALMTRAKPIPDGAVRVEIPVWFENGEFVTAETSVMAGRVQPFSDIFATVIAHVVPPVTQVVDGEVM